MNLMADLAAENLGLPAERPARPDKRSVHDGRTGDQGICGVLTFGLWRECLQELTISSTIDCDGENFLSCHFKLSVGDTMTLMRSRACS